MNIFFLDKKPSVAAEHQCDRHVVKMILETTQMLCTAYQKKHGIKSDLYKPAYPWHPMTIWVGETKANFKWAWELAFSLSIEYVIRYGKFHKCNFIISKFNEYYCEWLNWDGDFTTPPLCMPDKYKTDDFVESYKNYYVGEKKSFAKYKSGNIPEFMK